MIFAADSFVGTGNDGTTEQVIKLLIIRSTIMELLIVPVLRVCVMVCLTLIVMVFIEVLCMNVVIVYIKLFGKKPEKRYKWEPFNDDHIHLDSELGNNANYPMVLVQIPMYNEKEVYKLSIGAACGLSWPSDRIIIQVLDDSSDPIVKNMVERECQRHASEGINIKYESRANRSGYKAGAMKEGMSHPYAKKCEYVTIFDADFQPESDFLRRTVPFLVHNSELSLIQARCTFVNADECLTTKIQEMSLNFHFIVEQEVGSYAFAFFSFNGTAGVWRISAMDDAGGWKDRTTVEDMDLAVRASLKGWKFLYLSSVKVKSELPSKFKAFRYQQHRWSCGPANLFRKIFIEIIKSENVSSWKKVNMIYSFFFIRKVIFYTLNFVFFSIVLPSTVFVPEVEVPKWGSVYIPTIFTIINVLVNIRSLQFAVLWLIYENAMSIHRAKGIFIGLFETGSTVKEWVVTEKLGDASSKEVKKPRFRFGERIHWLEMGTGLYLCLCGCYDFAFGKNNYFITLFFQAIPFIIMASGYV